MLHSQPVRHFIFPVLFCIITSTNNLSAQSILLISSGTKVYDSYKDNKVVKLDVKEDTWVNYKGKYGSYFKISNFFGKDRDYPIGIFEGYVRITSVIDTASRGEYDQLTGAISGTTASGAGITPPTHERTSPAPSPREAKPTYDVDKYFVGMPKADALSGNKSEVDIGKSKYKIDLSFGRNNTLSELMLQGSPMDALAVEGPIRQQTKELIDYITHKFGKAANSHGYPSFLEIDENGLYEIASWSLPDKNISIGVGEKDDLYFSSLIIRQK
ncbi:MAG: hypothetical protein MI975_03075 [Cytophagales bacterium]|nr:hypothetical protein [Cytophagales bacterium]